MRRRTRAPGVLVAGLLLAGALVACSGDDEDRGSNSTTAQSGGTVEEPVSVTSTEALLQWVAAPGSADNSLTTNGTWFLTVDASGTGYALDGPNSSYGSQDSEPANPITNAMLNRDWAVVVRQDRSGQTPDVAEVTRLSFGQQFTIDQSTDVPTTTGGTWALGGDTLVHATLTPDGKTCLVSVDLIAQTSTTHWCVGQGQGFSAAHIGGGGTSLMTWDGATPACRTVATVVGDGLRPFDGAARCEGWDNVALGDDSIIWSQVPQNDQDAPAQFFARDGSDYFSLGRGTSGTLVPCGGAAYFVTDPQQETAPAQLVRWQDRELTVVYEAPPGQSFLEAPRCGEGAIVVTALSEAGNAQLMAALN